MYMGSSRVQYDGTSLTLWAGSQDDPKQLFAPAGRVD